MSSRSPRADQSPAPARVVGPEPTHSPEGVDLTLIHWMLSLTLLERLEVLQGAIDSLGRLRAQATED
jgi:hypothetical protein